MSAHLLPVPTGPMTVDDFLAWCAGVDGRWELFDGEPRAMTAPSRTHGTVQATLAALAWNRLRERQSPCRVVVTPGIRVETPSGPGLRIPDLAVTCTDYTQEQLTLPDPVLLVEILSPGNLARTWVNVWTYTTLPTVGEILVLQTDAVCAHLLRRLPGGAWPTSPLKIAEGNVSLETIDLTVPLHDLYRGTPLAQPAA